MTKEEMKDLVKWLNDRTIEYDAGAPTVTDFEWDREYFKLQREEYETGVILPDSPTHRIKYEVQSELKKKKHDHPMLSLAKTKDIEELKKFFIGYDTIFMLKMDGLTCSLRYEHGRLVSAETRGNGEEGEDITFNAYAVASIPKIIDYTDTLIVDGEIICTYNDFESFKEDYANPRNFAAGSIRLLDTSEVSRRKLTFIAWDIIAGMDYPSLAQKLSYLDDYGFKTVPAYVIDASKTSDDNIEELIDNLKEDAKSLGYPIDGIVVKWDEVALYKEAGLTGHHPKGALAFKFYDESIETELINIDYDVSRQGILTPVAVFEPIDLDGSELERASLHNISVMTETLHGPGWKGQKVRVYKANAIIPQISWAEDDDEKTKEYFSRPVCPICGATSVIKTSDAGVKILYCPNDECEGKLAQKIDHFLSLKGINAKGVSRKTIEFLIDKGWVKELKDVFNLESVRSLWEAEQGFGKASVKKILDGIESARTCTLEQVISGAGIPLVGNRVAKDISSRVNGSYEEFRRLIDTGFDFTQWVGYGNEMMEALLGFDYAELDYIVENYLNIKEAGSGTTTDSLAGKVFVITGKLSRKRGSIIADIEAAGGKVTSSVSAKTNYLICNAVEDTTKYHKAEQLNIPIITEEELNKMF